MDELNEAKYNLIKMYQRRDKVWIGPLKRDGEVLGRLKTGKYQVLVGGLVVECAERDLGPAKAKKRHASSLERAAGHKRGPKRPARHISVDLHGMTTEHAVEVLAKAVDRAILDDCDRLRVVHGLGTGKVMQAVHKYLGHCGVVAQFRLDEGNPGITWVYF